MNKDFNVDDNYLENEQIEAYEPPKNRRGNKIFICLICLLLSVVFWCYANYLNDPIIQKEITVYFVLVNGDASQDITPSKVPVLVYGEKSVINSIPNNTITVHVQLKDFENQTEINCEIDYPKGVHSHITHHTLKLSSSND
ncbi:MAG: hypothetical protein IKA84_02560 [Clostridia bacterium]|nr:hypothetical protein [Clostridia bacterium]